ncbi:MAG TPA: glutamate racemase [Patescibacteria group bacterium]|nr:glutamate racemase [Patescibacteria group bacterium]
MKIGIFDSGLGGLVVAKSIFRRLPAYDYIYLGDTGRVPYGNRSRETIYQFTRQAVDFLFRRNCGLVLLACNSASANALRRLQREYLPKHYPGRRILGVIVPTLEETAKHLHKTRLGVLATAATVNSAIYRKELEKIDARARIYEQAAPLLVPLIENNAVRFADPVLRSYLKPLQKKKIQALVLGCTHYPILKSRIKRLLGPKVSLICQNELLPGKLADYLRRHPELERKLGKNGRRDFLITESGKSFTAMASRLFGRRLHLKTVKLAG